MMELYKKLPDATQPVSIRLRNLRKTYYASGSIFSLRQRKGKKVLKGIDLTIYKGEVVGIIGRNGCGKSTLTRLICQSYKPDKGSEVSVHGVTTLASLSVGINPELSASENIMLSGVTYGKSIAAMRQSVPAILQFAELEDYAKMPVKHFSSGMASKLKFSIAMHSGSEIMLLDEVFAVGDLRFIEKATALLEEKWIKNRTVVMVSHTLPRIQKYCDRVVYIKDGVVAAIGDPDLVCREYRRDVDPNFEENEDLDALRDQLIREAELRNA